MSSSTRCFLSTRSGSSTQQPAVALGFSQVACFAYRRDLLCVPPPGAPQVPFSCPRAPTRGCGGRRAPGAAAASPGAAGRRPGAGLGRPRPPARGSAGAARRPPAAPGAASAPRRGPGPRTAAATAGGPGGPAAGWTGGRCRSAVPRGCSRAVVGSRPAQGAPLVREAATAGLQSAPAAAPASTRGCSCPGW